MLHHFFRPLNQMRTAIMICVGRSQKQFRLLSTAGCSEKKFRNHTMHPAKPAARSSRVSKEFASTGTLKGRLFCSASFFLCHSHAEMTRATRSTMPKTVFGAMRSGAAILAAMSGRMVSSVSLSVTNGTCQRFEAVDFSTLALLTARLR